MVARSCTELPEVGCTELLDVAQANAPLEVGCTELLEVGCTKLHGVARSCSQLSTMGRVPPLPDLSDPIAIREYLRETHRTVWEPSSVPVQKWMQCLECEKWVSVKCRAYLISDVAVAPVTCSDSLCCHGRYRLLAFGRDLCDDEVAQQRS